VTLFVLAMKWTTAANAILLQYTAPVYVAVVGPWLLGERASPRDWLAIGITFVGMSLFFMDNLTVTGFRGNIVALVSGVFFAGLILSMRYQKAGSPLETGLLGNMFVATLAVPTLALSPPPAESWIPLILLGVFQLGLAHLLYATALRSVEAIEAAIIPMIEPILSPLWVFLALGERPGPWALIGGGLVLGTVFVRGLIGLLSASTVDRRLRPSQLGTEPGP
jgi:drug/metabolite transporter (DMT)-like permease